MKVRIRASARRDLLKLPDAILIKAFRTILEIKDPPCPRGFKTVRGRTNRLRAWIDRNYRILYEVDSDADCVDVVRVGLKRESACRQRCDRTRETG